MEIRNHYKNGAYPEEPNLQNNLKVKKMKTYSVISLSSMWSTKQLKERVEIILNEKTEEGYEVITVAFGVNLWWIPTAYITLCK